MINRDEVLKIARLARLNLSETEMAQVQEKLNAMLDHFKSLSELATDNVEATYQGISELKLRVDIAEKPLDVRDLELNSPEFYEGSFKLPRVVGTAE